MEEARGAQGQDHAGVRVPPPALFLGSLLLGVLLERLWPLRWLDVWPAPLRYGLSLALLAGGTGLMAWAMGLFRKAGTAVPPWEPTTALVTTGPFAVSRNPIYLSVVMLYLGLTLLFAANWALIVLIPALLVLHFAVIRLEEAYLERRFGESYRQYRARVRRWF